MTKSAKGGVVRLGVAVDDSAGRPAFEAEVAVAQGEAVTVTV
jgi:hypothetical protein